MEVCCFTACGPLDEQGKIALPYSIAYGKGAYRFHGIRQYIQILNSAQKPLCERILRRIRQALRLVIADLAHIHTDVLEYFKQRFAKMAERNCTVMRVILLNQYMTVESAHLRNGEYTDTTERSGRHGKNLALRHVCGCCQPCSAGDRR